MTISRLQGPFHGWEAGIACCLVYLGKMLRGGLMLHRGVLAPAHPCGSDRRGADGTFPALWFCTGRRGGAFADARPTSGTPRSASASSTPAKHACKPAPPSPTSPACAAFACGGGGGSGGGLPPARAGPAAAAVPSRLPRLILAGRKCCGTTAGSCSVPRGPPLPCPPRAARHASANGAMAGRGRCPASLLTCRTALHFCFVLKSFRSTATGRGHTRPVVAPPPPRTRPSPALAVLPVIMIIGSRSPPRCTVSFVYVSTCPCRCHSQ